MKSLIGNFADRVRILTPDDGAQYFFGYYDVPATDTEGRHLCHRVSFTDRLPKLNDEAELGFVKDGVFTGFATTTAWNFQQGSFLQFHPTKSNTVCYNSRQNGTFCTVTHDLSTGKRIYTDRAAAALSADGRWGLGINFGRVFAFRPGYGYAGFTDKYADVNAPVEDGVFLIDMETGRSRLLVSYSDMGAAGFSVEDKILVNHINMAPDSKHYVMLVRNFPDPDAGRKGWSTSLVMGDLAGNIRTVLSNTFVSHYRWVNARELVAYCTVEEKTSMFLIDMYTGACRELDTPYFCRKGLADIHCNLLPEGKYIIGDGYPIEGYRYLIAYNRETGASKTLLGAKSMVPAVVDVRCDLHARFSADGNWITFDTTHNDRREIAAIPADVLNF